MNRSEDICRDSICAIAEETCYTNCNINIKRLHTGGANYTSHLFNAVLSAPDKEDLHLFAKVLCLGEHMRETLSVHLSSVEHYFYTELLKAYREIEHKYNIPEKNRLNTAKLYTSSTKYKEEILVLEDLSARGYESFDRFKTIDWEYATSGLKQLASFHALSIIFSKENKMEYDGVVKSKLLTNFSDLINKVLPNAIEKTMQVVKGENVRRLRKFLDGRDSRNAMQGLFEPSPLQIIIHGDFRPNNMMHKVNDGRTQVIALDYQTLQLGHPVADLLYFLLTGSDKQFRQRYLRKSFDFYHRELSAALERFGLEPSQIYSKEDYELDIKKFLPDMLIYCFLIILIVTVDGNDAPKVDMALAMEDFVVTPNALYAERINDLIDDCIEMGVL